MKLKAQHSRPVSAVNNSQRSEEKIQLESRVVSGAHCKQKKSLCTCCGVKTLLRGVSRSKRATSDFFFSHSLASNCIYFCWPTSLSLSFSAAAAVLLFNLWVTTECTCEEIWESECERKIYERWTIFFYFHLKKSLFNVGAVDVVLGIPMRFWVSQRDVRKIYLKLINFHQKSTH